jgi:hypothetical protein
MLEEIRHTVVIAGTVTNAINGQRLSDAVVELLGSNLHIQTGVDGSFYLIGDQLTEPVKLPTWLSKIQDGFFYFMDLPPGEYTLKVSAPNLGSRYEPSKEQKVTVPNLQLNVQLSPTQLVGQVKGSDNVNTIPNALVQLRGSETQTFTDKEGKYLLSGIQAGTPTVQVSEQGVVKYTQKVKLIAGEIITANFPNPNSAS